MEIRDKDSVRIYVEATLPNAIGQDPEENNDNIVFNLESGAEQKINLKAWAWNAELLRKLFGGFLILVGLSEVFLKGLKKK